MEKGTKKHKKEEDKIKDALKELQSVSYDLYIYIQTEWD